MRYSTCYKIIPYFLIFGLVLGLQIPSIAYADNHGKKNKNITDKCITHLKEMASLVKKYHEVTAEIETVNITLEGFKQKEESLTATEKDTVTSLQTIMKNLTHEQKIRLGTLDSKSERVIEHCPE